MNASRINSLRKAQTDGGVESTETCPVHPGTERVEIPGYLISAKVCPKCEAETARWMLQ